MWAAEESLQRTKLFALHGTGFFKAFLFGEEDRVLVDHRTRREAKKWVAEGKEDLSVTSKRALEGRVVRENLLC